MGQPARQVAPTLADGQKCGCKGVAGAAAGNHWIVVACSGWWQGLWLLWDPPYAHYVWLEGQALFEFLGAATLCPMVPLAGCGTLLGHDVALDTGRA